MKTPPHRMALAFHWTLYLCMALGGLVAYFRFDTPMIISAVVGGLLGHAVTKGYLREDVRASYREWLQRLAGLPGVPFYLFALPIVALMWLHGAVAYSLIGALSGAPEWDGLTTVGAGYVVFMLFFIIQSVGMRIYLGNQR
jgi:hypothetical protein